MGVEIELRHLRYFVAVAEAGSLTVAAQRKLFTSQPSLSRQIRDLEDEVGAQLLTRSARGIQLTPAGRAFLDRARSVLSQAFVDEFRKYYGPTMNAFEAAEKNGRATDLQRELEALFASQNKSPSKDATSIPATFLRVTVAP
jgi:LysR family transcriptional regulator, hca operon transcriptional activator